MSLVSFLVTLVCIAAVCGLVKYVIELPAFVKMIFYAVALIICLYLLLSIAGVDLRGLHLGR